MGKPGAVTNAALGLTAVVCLAVSAVSIRSWAEALDDRAAARARLGDAAAEAEDATVDAEAAQEAQAAAEDRADRLSGLFTPEATTAIVRLEDQAAESACEHARTATRNGTGLLTATQIVDDATATATDPQLARLPNRWPDLIDIESTQAEIDRCAAEEAAAIEAEQQAATAVEPETPIGYSECLADIPDYPELCLDLDGDGYAGYPDSG